LKYVLLSNLTIAEIEELIGRSQATCLGILTEAGKLNPEDILEKIRSLM
jgi:predicted transcriptional regulator